MLYTSSRDFFDKVSAIQPLSRDAEMQYVTLMKQGDMKAREIIINSYLPFVASYAKRYFNDEVTLGLIYRFLSTLEKSVDQFNFHQETRSFYSFLSLRFRRDCIEYIAGCD